MSAGIFKKKLKHMEVEVMENTTQDNENRTYHIGEMKGVPNDQLNRIVDDLVEYICDRYKMNVLCNGTVQTAGTDNDELITVVTPDFSSRSFTISIHHGNKKLKGEI